MGHWSLEFSFKFCHSLIFSLLVGMLWPGQAAGAGDRGDGRQHTHTFSFQLHCCKYQASLSGWTLWGWFNVHWSQLMWSVPLQGGCATFLCQPLDVMKTRLMNSKGEYTVSRSLLHRLLLILSLLSVYASPPLPSVYSAHSHSLFRGWHIAYERPPGLVHWHFTR